MKKAILIIILIIGFTQFSFAQNEAIAKIKYEEADQAYRNHDFETVVSKIDEIEKFMNVSSPVRMYLKIMSQFEIIKKNPLKDYKIIQNTRMLTDRYLKDYENLPDNMDKYRDIYKTEELLKSYPETEDSFLLEIKKLEDNEKAKQEQAALYKKQEQERREKAAIAEQARLKEENARQEAARQEAEVIRLKGIEKINKKSFSSLGFQSGEVTKYGLLYECAGVKSRVGFHMAIRSSIVQEDDISNGTVTKNKDEIDLGPNIRILDMLYINVGLGYGQYKYLLHDDYAQSSSVETSGYVESSIGVMLRIGRIINLNAGVSSMDLYKETYKPEITFGISFNLERKLK